MPPTTGYCPHCETPNDGVNRTDCCTGAERDHLLDLLAAFRGKRLLTADDITEAEALLADYEPYAR